MYAKCQVQNPPSVPVDLLETRVEPLIAEPHASDEPDPRRLGRRKKPHREPRLLEGHFLLLHRSHLLVRSASLLGQRLGENGAAGSGRKARSRGVLRTGAVLASRPARTGPSTRGIGGRSEELGRSAPPERIEPAAELLANGVAGRDGWMRIRVSTTRTPSASTITGLQSISAISG